MDPPSPTGQGSLATCGEIEPNPGPAASYLAEAGQQVLPLDSALLASGILGHFTLRPVLAVWHVMAGSVGCVHLPGWVCPYGGHTTEGAPDLAATQAASS